MDNQQPDRLVLGFDDTLMDKLVKCYIVWFYLLFPHMLVFGSTGSGKTYFVKLLLGRIGLYISGAIVILCDFKADDFKFAANRQNYYSFKDCTEGLDRFYNIFQARQQGIDKSRTFVLLVFDEWASYLNMLDKKEAEAAKAKLATLLMLGRSFNVHVLISQQRADAEYFAKSRDNFSVVIALGNISKESKQMFFSEYKDEMLPCKRGEGYMLTNGTELKRLLVPTTDNPTKVDHFIKKALGNKK